MKTIKIATAFGAAIMMSTSAVAAGLTYAEEEAMVSHAYVMPITKGEPQEITLRSSSEALVKTAYVMEPSYGTPQPVTSFALDEAVVDSAYDWSKGGFEETPFGNTAAE